MAATSVVTDDVDPAPRIFRIAASALANLNDPIAREIVKRFRRTAEVLEGRTMDDAEANLAHGRVLSKERRVAKIILVPEAPPVVVEKPGDMPLLSHADEQARKREIELGTYDR